MGKAGRGYSGKRRLQDHPHMCGESRLFAFFQICTEGSPPHVWGKRPHKRMSRHLARITPTCVGKAWKYPVRLHRRWDHPHMCGESINITTADAAYGGSPPHVWGKLILNVHVKNVLRITPTCVGKAESVKRTVLTL